MAISADQSILSLLKVYYKDGVENLMFRNDPVLKALSKEKIEGKTYNFSAMYGRGGAVSANYTVAKKVAANNTKVAEFAVEPGQLFSVCSFNQKEVLASKTRAGAFMKVAGAKFFAATEAFRKQMASALYGRGYGELCYSNYSTAIVKDTAFDLTLPSHAVMAIDIDSQLVLKATVESAVVKTGLTVTNINDATGVVTVVPDTAVAAPLTTDVICFDGSMDGSGKPLLPVGLGAWLPTLGKRTGAGWTTYIKTRFYGVDRSVAPSRLAGAFVDGTGDAKKIDTIIKLLKQARRQGSAADMIVMNDNDWAAVSKEIEATNTYMAITNNGDGKKKKDASIGFSELSASFSTNFFDNIIDSPYCPEGVFYVLDKNAIEVAAYTNPSKLEDGIPGNEPGKSDPMTEEGADVENRPYQLLAEDYLSIQPGTDTVDGPASTVSLSFFGSIAITNPSVCGVGVFANATVL
jgi:hypothetical protein